MRGACNSAPTRKLEQPLKYISSGLLLYAITEKRRRAALVIPQANIHPRVPIDIMLPKRARALYITLDILLGAGLFFFDNCLFCVFFTIGCNQTTYVIFVI